MGLIEEQAAEQSPDEAMPELHRQLGLMLLDALRLLVDDCKENAQLLHTSQGVSTVLRLVERRESSARALCLMRALLLTIGIDEHLAALLQLPARLQNPNPRAEEWVRPPHWSSSSNSNSRTRTTSTRWW